MQRLRSVDPAQAVELVDAGYVVVDVRTEEEFRGGHIPGAFNVPLMLAQSGRLLDNPDFVPVMTRAFATDTRLVLMCQAGGRSQRAAQLLDRAGFVDLVNMLGGWGGGRDAFGRRVAGWVERGLPSAATPQVGRSFLELLTGS